jgi:hypothetical protein
MPFSRLRMDQRISMTRQARYANEPSQYRQTTLGEGSINVDVNAHITPEGPPGRPTHRAAPFSDAEVPLRAKM